jgi:hypothetical protein
MLVLLLQRLSTCDTHLALRSNKSPMSATSTFLIFASLALVAPKLVTGDCQVKYQPEKLEIFWYCDSAELANCVAWDQSDDSAAGNDCSWLYACLRIGRHIRAISWLSKPTR